MKRRMVVNTTNESNRGAAVVVHDFEEETVTEDTFHVSKVHQDREKFTFIKQNGNMQHQQRQKF